MKQKSSPWRIVVLSVSALLVVSLSQSIYHLWHKKDIIRERQDVLEDIRRENNNLKARYQQVQTQEYIEQQARNELGYVKEGEIMVLLPNQSSPSAVFEEEEPEKPVATWQKWWQLFFGR